jgi:hypothetical protein
VNPEPLNLGYTNISFAKQPIKAMRRCEKKINTICFTIPLVKSNPDKPEMKIED